MNIPKLRFDGFSDEWEDVKLGDVCEIVDYRGKTPIKTSSGIFLVTAKNIKKGYIDYNSSKEYIDENDYLNVMSRGIPKLGDVLITTEAPCGNVAQVDIENIALAQRVIKYSGKDNILINKFLKYSLLSEKFQKKLFLKSTGGTVKGIKGSVLHKISIQLPSLSEQEKIGNFLSALDEKIQVEKDILENLINVKKGYTQKIFSQELRFDGFSDEWKEVKLGDVCEINMGQSPTADKYNNENIGLPLVQGNADIKDRKTLPKKYTSYITKIANIGDILMSVRAPVGSISKATIKVCIGRGVCSIKNTKDSIQEYIYQLLLTKENTWDNISQGGIFSAINSNEIKKLKLQLPSLPEQEKIAEFLSTLDERIKVQSEIIDNLILLKKGLLQQLFC